MPAGHGGTQVVGVSLKLYLDHARTLQWTRDVAHIASEHPAVTGGTVELFVMPSLPFAPAVLEILRGTPVQVGAQDLHWQDRGPATGGVSGADLRAIGCTMVEVNHAERRSVFGEDETVAASKLEAAARNGLTPVLCLGERENGTAANAVDACTTQLKTLLGRVSVPLDRLVVAYEPEWAIGAEAAAGPDHVAEVVAGIRDWLADRGAAIETVMLYGGSAGPGLLPQLGPDVDGLFLGRLAHDPAALAQVLDDTLQRRSA